jgi:GxxExxY protein
MEVHTSLGPGFLESIYRNALLHELQLKGISTESELEVQVVYKEVIVGRHRLDIVANGEVVIELKAVSGFPPIHIAQVLSYLKATGIEIGLLLNFGETSLSWKRLIKKPRIPRI